MSDVLGDIDEYLSDDDEDEEEDAGTKTTPVSL